MKYPCGIIKDLLPLCIDEIADEESRKAAEDHLTECENCRKYYEAMKLSNGLTENKFNEAEDLERAKSLKKIKEKINQKIRNVIITSVAAVLFLLFVFNLLFNMPVKNIDLNDISVNVVTYSMEEIATIIDSDDSVEITADGNGENKVYKLEIPSMPNVYITISEDTIQENDALSIVTWSSPYFMREIRYPNKSDSGSTIYVEAFKTTVFDNETKNASKSVQTIELGNIEKIVFVGDGEEKVLWCK